MNTPRYMDKFGLEYYHNLIKKGLIEYIVGTQNEETNAWTGVSKSPSLFAGKVIIYHLPFAGTGAAATLNLTLTSGSTTGAKAVQNETAGAVTTEYAADSDIFMVYTGSVWKCSAVDTTYAPLASPEFTGTPTAPTAAEGTSTTQIATTEFTTAAVGAEATIRQSADSNLAAELAAEKARVDSLVLGTTTNASGWNVETLTQNVTVSGGSASYNFTIPADATVLEVAVRSAASSSQPWITDNVNVYTNGTEAYVQADGLTVAEVVLKITYGKQGAIDLPELTDIRLGADGTTYPTAGEAVRGPISDVKEVLTKIENITYTQTEIAPFTSPNDWKLNPDTGIGVLDTDYKLTKFNVTPGTFLKIVSSYNFQFQSAQSVPSGGTSTRIGKTYGSGEYFLTVPDNGNYLIMSALKTSTTDHVYNLADRLEIVEQDLDGLKDNVESIEEALPKNTSYITVIDADTEGWETGYFYNGTVGATIAKTAYAGTSCRVYGSVRKGDVFNLNARSVGSAYAIILCDANNKVVQNYASTSGTAYYDAENYTVPQDGIMYLNTVTADYLSGNKSYFFKKGEKTYQSLKSVLNGIKWYSIGDSLNEFNATAEQNWIKYMIAGTGADNTNVAKSGSGFYRGSPLDGYTQINYIKQLESVGGDAELITVAGSFNDLMPSPWTVIPVGTASDTGTETIAGYMNTFFDALISNFPNTAIAVVMTSPWDVFKPGVEKSDDYVSVLKTICEKHGIPFYGDCYYGCNLRPWNTANKTEYYTHSDSTVDGVHPNSKGHVFIYRMIRPFLEKVVHVAP